MRNLYFIFFPIIFLSYFAAATPAPTCKKIFLTSLPSIDNIRYINELVELKKKMDTDEQFHKDQIYQLSMKTALQNGLNELIRRGGPQLTNLFFDKLKESQLKIKIERNLKTKTENIEESQNFNPQILKIFDSTADVIQIQERNLTIIHSNKNKFLVIVDHQKQSVRTIELTEYLSELQLTKDQKYIIAINNKERNSIARIDLDRFVIETIQLKKEYSITKMSMNPSANQIVIQTKKKSYIIDWNNPQIKQRFFIDLKEQLMQYINENTIVLRWRNSIYLYNTDIHNVEQLFRSFDDDIIQLTPNSSYLSVFNIKSKMLRIYDIANREFIYNEEFQSALQFQTRPKVFKGLFYLQTATELSVFDTSHSQHRFTYRSETKITDWNYNEESKQLIIIEDSGTSENQKITILKDDFKNPITRELPVNEVKFAYFMTTDNILLYDNQFIYFYSLSSNTVLYKIVKSEINSKVFSLNSSHLLIGPQHRLHFN